MANYYTEFSVIFEAEDDVLDRLEEKLTLRKDEDEKDTTLEWDQRLYGIGWKREDKGIWLYSEESPNLNVLTEVIMELQLEFNLKEIFCIEYADTCSKPRLDGFGGGAIVICEGESHWMHTSGWVEEKISELY